MTTRESQIYEGLASIGPEIARFFYDAVAVSRLDIETRPYILSHLSREIESGLRDVLAASKREKEEKCEKCEQLISKRISHRESILRALGISEENPLSKKWLKIAKAFPGYAHRHGILKGPRAKEEFDEHWNEFVDILEFLVGNYFSIANRIDAQIKNDNPTAELIASLPNLLKNDSRNVYFFSNIKSKKWLKPLFDANYFDPNSNPVAIESYDQPGQYTLPFWPSMRYLEVVSLENLNNPDNDTSDLLIQICIAIYNFKKDDERVINSLTDHSLFLVLSSLPLDRFDKNIFGIIKDLIKTSPPFLIGREFQSLFQRMIDCGEKSLVKEGLEILFSFKVLDRPYDKIESIFESYLLVDNVQACKDDLIKKFPTELFDSLTQKVESMVEIDGTAFHSFSLPAIEDHEQTSFPDKLDCQITYMLRDCLVLASIDFSESRIKKLLASPIDIFQRLGIHTINKRYSELGKLIWDWKSNPVELIHIKHELYELFKDHSNDFKAEEITQLIQWIDKADYWVSEETKRDEKVAEKVIANEKRMWMSSLASVENKELQSLSDRLNKIDNTEIQHPGFNSWHSGLIGTVSPLDYGEMERKSLPELLQYFDQFSSEEHDFIGPSVDGFIDMFIIGVQKNPTKFSGALNYIGDDRPEIFYGWASGIERSIRDENNTFKTEEIFDRILEIVSNPKFWSKYKEISHLRWTISSVLSLIEFALQNDGHQTDERQMGSIKGILFSSFDKVEREQLNSPRDLHIDVLNSNYGKVISALINYSLRKARIENLSKERWDKDVKALIDDSLTSENDPILFFLLGEYMPNINYLDEGWLKQNFERIFEKESSGKWLPAVRGYFTHHKRPEKVVFYRFLEGQHFDFAFKTEFKDIPTSVKDSIIYQICGAYVAKFEHVDLESTVFQSLLHSNKAITYPSIINFFSISAFLRDEDTLNRIKSLWKVMHKNCIELKEQAMDVHVLSGCCKWLKHFRKIDAEIELLLKSSVKFLTLRDRTHVLSLLFLHTKENLKLVGEILIEIFKIGVNHDMSRGGLGNTVLELYASGEKQLADQICILHAEKSFYFLRDIYNQNNQY